MDLEDASKLHSFLSRLGNGKRHQGLLLGFDSPNLIGWLQRMYAQDTTHTSAANGSTASLLVILTLT